MGGGEYPSLLSNMSLYRAFFLMKYQPSSTSAAKPTKPPTAPPTMGAMFVPCDWVDVGGALTVVAGKVEVLVRVAVDTLPSDRVVYDCEVMTVGGGVVTLMKVDVTDDGVMLTSPAGVVHDEP